MSSEFQLPVVRTQSGGKGGWNKELYTPKPNTTYIVDNKFVYHTDDLGRVRDSSAKLDELVAGARHPGQQTKAGGDDRAMKASLNGGGKGQYGDMEREWADAIRQGKSVEVSVKVNYDGASLRPSS
ncbi:hypothetical protein EH165_12430 [Nakamurella antarctica]|uniref:Type VII secretion system protein EssD-like domain-containing protein n=1 Tax=Nakamurella antarctica TaxID=1902245 RepID=A0A3G8ZNJ9_9ACTN|nr:DNA/RNA non-specific endonuclease [Nakamurella antarctica]AZI58823.1 hypothetical protein EH165_12430 [Nakamurella antarctica]